MAEAKTLKEFRVTLDEAGETARMHIADESGGRLELTLSREQLDVIADEIDALLDQTEGADEVEDASLND